MAVDFTQKQKTFVQKYVSLIAGILNMAPQIADANEEFTQNTYGTGGQNAIPDAIVQAIAPAATAPQFNSAEGAMVTILQAIEANRGYLEALRQ